MTLGSAEGQTTIARVAAHTGISASVILGRSRTMAVTYARHLAIYLLWKQGESIMALGGLFDRDRSTVLHAVRRIEAERYNRAETRADLEALEKEA